MSRLEQRAVYRDGECPRQVDVEEAAQGLEIRDVLSACERLCQAAAPAIAKNSGIPQSPTNSTTGASAPTSTSALT